LAPRTSEQFEKLRVESKQRIVTAAFHLFAEEGYHGTSVSKIAKKAGVSKGLLYNYYESKEDLLLGIMDSLLSEINEYFAFDSLEEVDEEVILEWVDTSFDIVLKDLKKWKLYVALSTQPEVTPIFMKAANEPIKKFMAAFHKLFEEKGVEQPTQWIRHIAAMVDGVQLHIMMDPENYPVEHSRQIIKSQIKALLS